MTSPYLEMVASKAPRPEFSGLASLPPLSGHLRGYQRATTEFGLAAGRWGCFLDTGLGKTLVEHEWGMHAAENSNGRTLILCPLAVAQQQRREGERFGYPIRVIRDMDGVGEGLNVCNYDRVHLLDPEAFGAVILDESAILRSMTGKVSEDLRRRFAHHRWRLAAAAVPAPNDHTEMGQTADFLGVMSARKMLMRWFTPDHSKTQAYRLLRHGEEAFWEWVAGWARAAGHPADLGFPEEDFTVPDVRIIRHAVDSAVRIDGSLFGGSVSATSIHDVKRQTSSARAEAMAAMIAQEPGEPWVVWVDTDYEADAALDALRRIDKARAIDVRGSMSTEKKEAALDRFSASGEPLVLVTKPEIAGLGLNWQHCARTWFMGRSFSYLNFYQAVRRFKRYGQQREVQIHLSIAEGEDVIGRSLDRKAEDHRRMMAHMVEAMKRVSVTPAVSKLTPYAPASSAPAPSWLGGVTVEALDHRHGQRFALFNGDCVEVMRQLPDACLDLTVYSPPFAGLYIYSDSPADMGNCADDDEFLRQYRYAVEEKYRVTRPGRLSAVHCKDLRNLAGTTGRSGLRDFQGKIIEVHQSAGWELHTRITLWRCPVKQQATSKGSRLNYKDLMRDATFSMMGTPEYLLIFRRWAETEAEKNLVVPVQHAPENFPLPQWQTWASPVWGYPPSGDSLDETDVLGSDKEASDEKHICPLPMDITRRVVRMWSNPGDVVGSMFAGIGSEGVVALEEGRRSVGIELKPSYFKQNGEWLDGIDRQMGLFS
jgi:DNA modification methylase